jgi:hypothetical protein
MRKSYLTWRIMNGNWKFLTTRRLKWFNREKKRNKSYVIHYTILDDIIIYVSYLNLVSLLFYSHYSVVVLSLSQAFIVGYLLREGTQQLLLFFLVVKFETLGVETSLRPVFIWISDEFYCCCYLSWTCNAHTTETILSRNLEPLTFFLFFLWYQLNFLLGLLLIRFFEISFSLYFIGK